MHGCVARGGRQAGGRRLAAGGRRRLASRPRVLHASTPGTQQPCPQQQHQCRPQPGCLVCWSREHMGGHAVFHARLFAAPAADGPAVARARRNGLTGRAAREKGALCVRAERAENVKLGVGVRARPASTHGCSCSAHWLLQLLASGTRHQQHCSTAPTRGSWPPALPWRLRGCCCTGAVQWPAGGRTRARTAGDCCWRRWAQRTCAGG